MATKKTAAKKPAVGKGKARASAQGQAKRGTRAAPTHRAGNKTAAATKATRASKATKATKATTKAKPKAVTLAALLKIGRDVLGITELRPGQAEALRHILAGRDVLAVMPTGSGKSLLYQLPSLVLPGLTVVVSPLLALITDQVKKMQDKGVAIARVDSTLTVKQKREMLALLDAPGGRMLLTTPERMTDPEFRALLVKASGKAGVSRFVVDEAHCVSQWGHDFRPAYLTLRQAIEDLGRPPVLATTATAPPHVRDDILFQLGIPEAKIVTTSFERPNLSFEVITSPGDDDKQKILVTLLKKLKRPGIVYCATVKAVEKLGEDLARHGVPVATYHGRMTKKERDEMQTRFMASRTQRHGLVMVATNAFGLGVDKADIRYVLHYHVPGSLEQYAQEAGRGGRDGLPTRCVLLFSPDDVAIQEHFLKGTYPTRRQVLSVFDALAAWGDRRPTLADLATSSHVGAQRTRTVLALLKDEGWVVEERGARYHLADPHPDRGAVRERALDYEKRRIADRRRLDALLDYVRTSLCRNTVILDYLGEKIPKTTRCGRCDNCLRSAAEARAAAAQAEALEAELVRWSREAEDDIGDDSEPDDTSPRIRMISLDEPAPAREPAAAPPEVEVVDSIDRTAAELVEEGHDDEGGEITVLKRRRRAPVETVKAGAAAADGAAGGRKKRRKRRKKGKGLAPTAPVAAGQPPAARPMRSLPSVVFTSPVAVMTPTPAPAAGNGQPAAAPAPSAGATAPSPASPASPAHHHHHHPHGHHHAPAAGPARTAKSGPIVEYVRRPMKIAVAPVASATPHDNPLGRKKHKRRQFEARRQFGAPPGGLPPAPGVPPALGAAPSPTNADGTPRFGAPGGMRPAQPGQPNAELGGSKKKRRRRRKKKKGMGLHPGAPPSPTASFWMPADAPLPPPGARPAPAPRPPAPAHPAPATGDASQGAAPTAAGPGGAATGPNGEPGLGRKKRRRRRRRRRGGGMGMGMGHPLPPGAPVATPEPNGSPTPSTTVAPTPPPAAPPADGDKPS